MPATDTAWGKVVTAIQTACATTRADVHWFTMLDRDPSDPLTSADLPGAIIGLLKVDFSYHLEQGQMRHDGQIAFSLNSGIVGSLNIDPVNQDIAASIVSTLAASDLLGGMVDFLDPVSLDPTEQEAADVGEALLIFACQFYTPTDDFRTIIGRSGLTF